MKGMIVVKKLSLKHTQHFLDNPEEEEEKKSREKVFS